MNDGATIEFGRGESRVVELDLLEIGLGLNTLNRTVPFRLVLPTAAELKR